MSDQPDDARLPDFHRWDMEGGETPLVDVSFTSGIEQTVEDAPADAASGMESAADAPPPVVDDVPADEVSAQDESADELISAEAFEPAPPITRMPVLDAIYPAEPPPAPEPAISVWTLLLRPKRAAVLRIDGLGRAIEQNPNAPSNFVLRGELYLKLKRYADAEMDFRRALDLAAAQVESQDWGVVAQVVQDRALAGLRQSRTRR